MTTTTSSGPVVLGACEHTPPCPPFGAADHDAAHIVAFHPEQGWWLLCNGVVVLDDTGELLPDGTTVAPHRPEPPHAEDSQLDRMGAT